MRNKQKKNHFSPISAFKRKIICNVRFFPMLKKKKFFYNFYPYKKKKEFSWQNKLIFLVKKKIKQKSDKTTKKKRTFLFNLNPPLLCVCAQREKTSTDLVN